MKQDISEEQKDEMLASLSDEELAALAESLESNMGEDGSPKETYTTETPKPEGNEDDLNEVTERFVLNVMKLASGSEHDKMVSMAMSSKENIPQGFARAMYFIMSAVKKGLEDKGVEIPSALWLAPNGLIGQSAKIVGVLLDAAGMPLDEATFSEGIQLSAKAMAGAHQMKIDQASEPAEEEQMPPQGQLPPQGQPPQPTPAPAPQQGGMLPPQGKPQ